MSVGPLLVLALLVVSAVGPAETHAGGSSDGRASAGAQPLGAGDPTNRWSNITSGEYGGLPARWGMGAAWDPAGNVDLFYGGGGAGGSLHNDTWITDDATIRNISDGLTTGSPPPLEGASVAYDAANSYFLLFGGELASGRASGSTWTFSSGGAGWSNVTASAGTAPPAQAFAPMAYDARDGYVVLESSVGPHLTWTFVAGHWSPSNVTGPSARTGASLTEDPQVASLILFGGATATGAGNETWAYAAGRWDRLSLPAYPPAEVNGSAAYDPVSGLLLEFGGSGSAEVWGFNGTDWTILPVSGSVGPSPRIHAQMLYDDQGPFVTVFGGRPASGGPPYADFWAWNPPVASSDPTSTAAAVPPWVAEVGVAAIVVPIGLAILYYKPPGRKPTEAPTAERRKVPTPA